MRLMSFALTARQVLERTKTVTRRLGWRDLKPGTLLRAVKKARGVPVADRVELAVIRVEAVTCALLREVWYEDVVREGFLGMTAMEFVAMFCRKMRCKPSTVVTRIEFSYYDGPIQTRAHPRNR